MECRIARFHNIYGPYGTWKGGREKAPAAFCRKVLTSDKEFEMWGDGKQTRSFTFIDDCVEGILRITKSDFREPLNLGSSEMVLMGGGDMVGRVRDGMMGSVCINDVVMVYTRDSPPPKKTHTGEHERHGRDDYEV